MNKISLIIGVASIIFAAIIAVLSYEVDTLQYVIANVPPNFLQLTIVVSMMPYLASAVLSFIVAFITAKVTKDTDGKIIENQIETKPKQETELEKTAQKEMETA